MAKMADSNDGIFGPALTVVFKNHEYGKYTKPRKYSYQQHREQKSNFEKSTYSIVDKFNCSLASSIFLPPGTTVFPIKVAKEERTTKKSKLEREKEALTNSINKEVLNSSAGPLLFTSAKKSSADFL